LALTTAGVSRATASLASLASTGPSLVGC